MASVELKNVWKMYGPVEAVRDASWKCDDREFFSILGPSGCGKSSTLRMIAGLEEITRGEILFDGVRVNKLPPRERNVAMVFENWALYPNLTVFENIAFPLKVRAMEAAHIHKKVTEAARFLNLEPLLQSSVRRLSGGEMQRVSIARAIVREPAVLIMDEPISHLDAGLRARLRDELKTQVAELGVTTLYITHDQVESMAMANRIAVMNLGMIQQVGSPLEIYYNPRNEFVAGFIGEPPMNFSAGELVQEAELVLVSASFKIVLGSEARLRLRTHQGSARLNVGVRPEDFHLSDSEEPNTFPAEVDFVERQGDRAIITLKSKSGEIFLAQSMEGFRPAAGRTVHVSIDQRHMHFFDPETGLNVLQSQGRKT